MAWYNWSQTPAANATADSTINWQEGQAPSSINDSARAMMAATAKYRDDIAGAILTAGTNTAYTVTSYSVFDTLAHLNGQMIAFTPHTTNGAVVTLNVDSLGPKPLRSAPNVELQAGTIIQGTPYVATYNNSDGAFYLHGFYGNPYNVPLGAGMDFWGFTAPNSSFVFPYGQAISRTTYSTYFEMVGTSFGAGDGSTTFNLPDVRGRVVAALDNLSGGDAGRLINGGLSGARNSLGQAGGEAVHTLAVSELPTGITSSGSSSSGGLTISGNNSVAFPTVPTTANIANVSVNTTAPALTGTITSTSGSFGANSISQISVGAGTANVISNNTSGSSHNNCQPTIMAAYIMRII